MNLIIDAMAVSGVAMIGAGVFMIFGPGAALIAVGTQLLSIAVYSAHRQGND